MCDNDITVKNNNCTISVWPKNIKNLYSDCFFIFHSSLATTHQCTSVRLSCHLNYTITSQKHVCSSKPEAVELLQYLCKVHGHSIGQQILLKHITRQNLISQNRIILYLRTRSLLCIINLSIITVFSWRKLQNNRPHDRSTARYHWLNY